MRLFPRRRGARILATVVAVPFPCLLLLYLFLLVMQAYSAHEAARILDRVEALRIGDSEAKFHESVEGCHVIRESGSSVCYLAPWQYSSKPFVQIWRLLPGEAYVFAGWIGLRDWWMGVSAEYNNGRITKIHGIVAVLGQHEGIGVSWHLVERVHSFGIDQAAKSDRPATTSIYWSHITSEIGGRALGIELSPSSAPAEFRARHINPSCLNSLKGCANICELVPEAPPVIRSKDTFWPGCK